VVSKQEFEEIYHGIRQLRSSLDMGMQFSKLPRNATRLDNFKSVAIKLEEILIDLRLAIRTREDPSVDTLYRSQINLRELLDDISFHDISEGIKFRISAITSRNTTPELKDFDLVLIDAAQIILRRMDEIIRGSVDQEESPGTAALRRVVPDQKLAPAMFNIVAGKIVVVKQPPQAQPDDALNVQRARDMLIDRGRDIIEALERSNSDRRIIESMRELQTELEAQDNIIELGLINIAVASVCKGAAAELPDALLGSIEGQTAGIGMYVAQFPEWQRFSENAASVELDVSDVERIGEAAQAVIDKLALEPGIADDEVPKTLTALRALIANPKLATKRSAFAVLRTVENLVAKIYQYGAEFLDKTITKTIDGVSSATSKLITASLFTVALVATAHLGGVTGKVAETAWMKTAAEIVRKQLEETTK